MSQPAKLAKLSDADSKVIAEEVVHVQADVEAVQLKKQERLKSMDFFVLDNSIRESTVAQLRGHTIEKKKKIFEQIKKCGIRASLSLHSRI